MTFEWDERKEALNVAKHGVPFEYAARLFLDSERIDEPDLRRDYREERRIAVGRIETRVFVAVYVRRESVIRLISARKANEREQRRYYATLPS